MHLRYLQQRDNASVAAIIRRVSAECGLAAEQGFAVADSVVDDLYAVYSADNAAYWVVVDEQDTVWGGGGVALLRGASEVMEVQKMYFLPETRGLGLARQILQRCEAFARSQGIAQLYLETTHNLGAAVALYRSCGFVDLPAPLGDTGHSQACEIYMSKSLD